MCFESLVDGDATEKPLRTLIREEMGSAVTDGSIAALVVLAVLLVDGTALTLTAGATVAALVFGVVLHQLVLVVGVGLVRWRGPEQASTSPESV